MLCGSEFLLDSPVVFCPPLRRSVCAVVGAGLAPPAFRPRLFAVILTQEGSAFRPEPFGPRRHPERSEGSTVPCFSAATDLARAPRRAASQPAVPEPQRVTLKLPHAHCCSTTRYHSIKLKFEHRTHSAGNAALRLTGTGKRGAPRRSEGTNDRSYLHCWPVHEGRRRR